MENPKNDKSSRRDALKFGLASTVMAALTQVPTSLTAKPKESSGEKVRLLTPDGHLVEVDANDVVKVAWDAKEVATDDNRKRAREGIKGRKWVLVIDLARCKHALACQSSCNKHHHIPGDRQWLNVYTMQDAEHTEPYWMPKTCFHCDKPACVSVCPVDATFKRDDGIVLIDNERCIGCRFCMAACPYSTRVFNWGEPNDPPEVKAQAYDPEKGLPRKKGTVEKCDFCPDMLRNGKLPHCATACPNGVFFFGDQNEDTVTNGAETYRFSDMMKDKAGYRYLEDLGTEPRVYYLPAADRLVPYKESENLPPLRKESGSCGH
ncbi:MAG: 4Fe-4S dicluster domain-containing protein [Flavobacteriales bacterium]|nr:4Fe-4S dicluster domain-containing protein [Flavobacteriales bacterium]